MQTSEWVVHRHHARRVFIFARFDSARKPPRRSLVQVREKLRKQLEFVSFIDVWITFRRHHQFPIRDQRSLPLSFRRTKTLPMLLRPSALSFLSTTSRDTSPTRSNQFLGRRLPITK